MIITGARLYMMARLPEEFNYKGMPLGFLTSPQGFISAAWRWPDGTWEESCVLVRNQQQVPQLAADCIEYQMTVRAMERVLGRKLHFGELPRTVTGVGAANILKSEGIELDGDIHSEGIARLFVEDENES